MLGGVVWRFLVWYCMVLCGGKRFCIVLCVIGLWEWCHVVLYCVAMCDIVGVFCAIWFLCCCLM